MGKVGNWVRMIPAWLSYFLPGFHPWNHDDRALIQRVESAYEAALVPTVVAAA